MKMSGELMCRVGGCVSVCVCCLFDGITVVIHCGVFHFTASHTFSYFRPLEEFHDFFLFQMTYCFHVLPFHDSQSDVPASPLSSPHGGGQW